LHGRAFREGSERRSRTTYRPTVAPEGSTHVDTAFTGPTSSFCRTVSGRLATVAVAGQRVLRCFRGQKPLHPVGHGLDQVGSGSMRAGTWCARGLRWGRTGGVFT
jgi:hypothetical protein